ncbi:DUF2190 family protein [Agrobacterium sp. BT-220-3]|nr:DUF2190 family protein [Agrobacterium sp. BT-220-3]
MKNYIQEGDILNLTAPAGGLASGQAHMFGDLFGVAAAAAAEGAKVAVSLEGVFSLPKATGASLTEGQKVYWIAADKKVTATANGNTLIGHAARPAAADAVTAEIRIKN